MMLRSVPNVVSSQPLRGAPGVAVNGTVAGNHGNTSCLLLLYSLIISIEKDFVSF